MMASVSFNTNTEAEKKAARIGLFSLLRIMREAQRGIVSVIEDSLFNETEQRRIWDRRNDKIVRLFDLIKAAWATYIKDEVPRQYALSRNAVDSVMRTAGKQIIKVKPSIEKVAVLIEDSIARMNLATTNGKEQVQTLLVRTQQAITEDRIINRKIAQGLTDQPTPQKLKELIKSDLVKKLRGGNVVSINGRNYNVDKYAELVARTRTREAQSIATMQAAREYGEDLVRISDHNTTTLQCLEHEGLTYSLTGGTPGVPILADYPPFHPNCQHVMTVAALADVKEVQKRNAKSLKKNESRAKEIGNQKKPFVKPHVVEQKTSTAADFR